MTKTQIIIVQYVSPRVYTDMSKLKTKYLVQFAGVSGSGKKLMRLQVWDMPFDSMEEAKKTLADFLEKTKDGRTFIVHLIGQFKKNND